MIEFLLETTFNDTRPKTVNGKKMFLVHGQFFIQKRAFAKRCGWNRPKFERFLKELENDPDDRFAITQETVWKDRGSKKPPLPIGTIITFINIDSIWPDR